MRIDCNQDCDFAGSSALGETELNVVVYRNSKRQKEALELKQKLDGNFPRNEEIAGQMETSERGGGGGVWMGQFFDGEVKLLVVLPLLLLLMLRWRKESGSRAL